MSRGLGFGSGGEGTGKGIRLPEGPVWHVCKNSLD